MSVLPQLERDLLAAANRRHGASDDGDLQRSRPLSRLRGRTRPLRLIVLALGCLLAITTITLAASGVILQGAPVHPEELLNPSVGEGVPAQGASQLLTLRTADPEGGLPWGMRVVRTTRADVCIQLGRIQNGQLGELGIDGAFHNDGRFHPMPANALPADVFHGHAFGGGLANANTSCQLAGEASADYHIGLERSAAANIDASARPLRDLRDIYYGILGADAVSVSYRAGETERTAAVLPRIGAYLIVRRTAPGQQIETGGGSLGSEGDLPPSAPLTAITYRLEGRLCQRGPSEPAGAAARLADPCPYQHSAATPARTPEMHQKPQIRLQISRATVIGAEVRFTAPFAVTSARDEYAVAIPTVACGHDGARGTGLVLESLARDVTRGELLTSRLAYPFANACGRRITVEVLYRQAGQPMALVGSSTVDAPAGTRLAAPAGRRRRHYIP